MIMSSKIMIASVALFYRDGSSDKEYNAFLEQVDGGYTVNFAYGRRGNANSTGTKTNSPVTLEAAQKIYDKLVSEKTAKGYVPDSSVDAKPFTTVDMADRVTGMLPMLLNPIDEVDAAKYIKDPNWIAQEKLDGKRIMVRVGDGVVTASNRKGLSVGLTREIESALLQFKDIVLDGELIGDKYFVFDVLEVNGQYLKNTDCDGRFRILENHVYGVGSPFVRLVSSAETEAQKQALYDSLKAADKEGIVFKKRNSVYVPGRPASGGNQIKCKFWSDVSVKVLALNDKRSVAVGIRFQVGDSVSFVNVGNVTVPPNYPLPNVGDTIDVTYLYAYKGGSLYQPKYRGVRDDVEPDTQDKLKFKAENTDEDA